MNQTKRRHVTGMRLCATSTYASCVFASSSLRCNLPAAVNACASRALHQGTTVCFLLGGISMSSFSCRVKQHKCPYSSEAEPPDARQDRGFSRELNKQHVNCPRCTKWSGPFPQLKVRLPLATLVRGRNGRIF